MMRFVLDCSVAVKCFIKEALSEDALRLFETSEVLYAPDLILAEFSHAMTKHTRSGQIAQSDAKKAVSELRNDLAVMRSSISAYQIAIELAVETGGTAQDCLYLAHAFSLQVPLITADVVFVDRLRQARPNAAALTLQEWASSA
jgi:predicted nucleic acid-binding protein